jgi:hypothetical protein
MLSDWHAPERHGNFSGFIRIRSGSAARRRHDPASQ